MMKTTEIRNSETQIYTVDNTIASQTFDKLQVQKLIKTESMEVLSITLEKDTIFPEHTSPTDARLVMLEGSIVFHINREDFFLEQQQSIGFPKKKKHWVEAHQNAKFLIIR